MQSSQNNPVGPDNGEDLTKTIYDAAERGDKDGLSAAIAKSQNLESLSHDINKDHKNGWTPLDVAAYNNNADCLKLLIAAGADVNKPSNNGKTPVWRAARSSNADCLKLLIAADTDVNKANNDGQTPVYAAARNNYADCLKLLIAAGADVKKANSNGKTPLQIASDQNSLECFNILFDMQFTGLSLSETFLEKLKQGISDPMWATYSFMDELWQEVSRTSKSRDEKSDAGSGESHKTGSTENMTELLLRLLCAKGNSSAVIALLKPAVVPSASIACTQTNAGRLARIGYDVRQEKNAFNVSKLWADYGKAQEQALKDLNRSIGDGLDSNKFAALLLPCCCVRYGFASLHAKLFPQDDQQLTTRPAVRCNLPGWTSPEALLALHQHASLDVFEQEAVTALIKWKWQRYGQYFHATQMAL